jgi:hypothetical protein
VAGRALPAAARPPALQVELRGVVALLRPSPEEILSLWPEHRRHDLVVWIIVDAAGGVQVAARLREHDFDAGGLGVAREVRRIRGDVPLVFELPGDRKVVVPLRKVSAGDAPAQPASQRDRPPTWRGRRAQNV